MYIVLFLPFESIPTLLDPSCSRELYPAIASSGPYRVIQLHTVPKKIKTPLKTTKEDKGRQSFSLF